MIRKNLERICKNYKDIENYNKAVADTKQLWICHHRRENIYTKDELLEIGEYYHRPAEELIFVTVSYHKWLHYNVCKGCEAYREKISSRNKGCKNPMSNIPCTYKMSDDQIKAWKTSIGNALRGRIQTYEHKMKRAKAHQKKIVVTDLCGNSTIMNSIKETSEAFNINRNLIKYYIYNQKAYKGLKFNEYKEEKS